MDSRDLRRAYIAALTRFEKLTAMHDTKWNAPYIDDILAIRVAQTSSDIKKIMREQQVDAVPVLDEFEKKGYGGM